MGCTCSTAVEASEPKPDLPQQRGDGVPRLPIPRLEQYYEVYHNQVLGQGHYGKVYKAKQKATGRIVAVKVLERSGSKAERLRLEIEILRRLGKHPHIVELLGVFETPSTVYLVFELMAGELFERLASKGGFRESEAAIIVYKLTRAIQFLHENHVCHRDIKPENLLMTSKTDDADVKLSDFGLACFFGDDESHMKTVCGTWAYSAPEVRVKRGGCYTPKVDMWSLGVIVFILLSGYHPFDPDGNATEGAMQDAVRRGRYNYDDPVWKRISITARDLIDHLLVLDPDKRFSTVDVLAHPWIKQTVPAPVAEAEIAITESMRLPEPTPRKSKAPGSSSKPQPIQSVFTTLQQQPPGTPVQKDRGLVLHTSTHKITPARTRSTAELPPISLEAVSRTGSEHGTTKPGTVAGGADAPPRVRLSAAGSRHDDSSSSLRGSDGVTLCRSFKNDHTGPKDDINHDDVGIPLPKSQRVDGVQRKRSTDLPPTKSIRVEKEDHPEQPIPSARSSRKDGAHRMPSGVDPLPNSRSFKKDPTTPRDDIVPRSSRSFASLSTKSPTEARTPRNFEFPDEPVESSRSKRSPTIEQVRRKNGGQRADVVDLTLSPDSTLMQEPAIPASPRIHKGSGIAVSAVKSTRVPPLVNSGAYSRVQSSRESSRSATERRSGRSGSKPPAAEPIKSPRVSTTPRAQKAV